MTAIMFQGTGSDVGKSMLTAGIARALVRRGFLVQPFKPQNMSNNAAVTADGGEIGRAQALQARACGVAPSVHMNPVLLKPQSEVGSQVVVQGKVRGNAKAREYQAMKPELLGYVLESFAHLRQTSDLVLVEGAGSPAEINLRAGDIANMGFAEAADVPVVLVADIDRGGVIASVVGTWMLLTESERARVVGYVINKFRGDVSLFDSAIDIIESHTGWPCFGVLPWFAAAGKLPAEDAMAIPDARANSNGNAGAAGGSVIRVAVPVFSRIANFDDLDPLIAEPDVQVSFVPRGKALPGDADLIVLPGSKSTMADLALIRDEGWDVDLAAHVRRGGWVVGLCGGYQMLGARLEDPDATEGIGGAARGLGLLDVVTVLDGDKTLVAVDGEDVTTSLPVTGYEMHIGKTSGPGLARPMLMLDGVAHGAISPGGRIQGCYLHGLFAQDAYRHAFLAQLAERLHSGVAYEQEVEQTLDELAEHVERHLAIDRMLVAMGQNQRSDAAPD
jgi:adenosylcobyric acid synthase